MQKARVHALIFEGGPLLEPPLDWLDHLREAIVLDQIERAEAAGAHVMVASDRPGMLAAADGAGAETIKTSGIGAFHFGHALADICRRHVPSQDAVICLGGGSGALMGFEDWDNLVRMLEDKDEAVTANSLFSSDIIGFRPAGILEHAEPMPLDNQLAWTLRDAGLTFVSMPATTRISFDIDTPTDGLVFAIHPGRGRHARAMLESVSLPLERVRRVVEVLRRGHGEVFLYGRIGNGVLATFEAGTRCRARTFVEERGMRARGRDAGGAFSLLGALFEKVGAGWWMEQVARVCEAALLDTRALFAHGGRVVSTVDRFRSDLGELEGITDGFVREVTRVMKDAGIPVLAGGHSLVNGGIRALLEIAAGPEGQNGINRTGFERFRRPAPR